MQRLKIKNFSNHIGVSLDTIKHYQDCGIIAPEIDTTNNYRYYNMTHAERIIVSRRFRNLGFNIENTKQMISKKDGTEIQMMFQKRYAELEEEIEL